MKDYPYFKAYVAEILMDTMGMSYDEKGRYLDSLLIAWKTSDPSKMPQWMQEYADETIKKSAKLSENSKVRWSNAMQLHSKSNAKAMQTPYIEDRIGEDRIGKDRREIKKTPLPPTGEFDEFWNLYPKKIDKQGANKALLRALKKTTIRIITEAVLVARESPQWQRNEGQYIPNPTTWLNQERWSAVVEVEDKQSWSYLNRELLKGAQSGQDHLAIGRDF